MAQPCTHFHPPSICIHLPPTSARIHLPSTYFHSTSIHIPHLSVTSTHLQQPPLIFHPPSTYFHQPSTHLHLPPLTSTYLHATPPTLKVQKFGLFLKNSSLIKKPVNLYKLQLLKNTFLRQDSKNVSDTQLWLGFPEHKPMFMLKIWLKKAFFSREEQPLIGGQRPSFSHISNIFTANALWMTAKNVQPYGILCFQLMLKSRFL